jgi:hypothetical protein
VDLLVTFPCSSERYRRIAQRHLARAAELRSWEAQEAARSGRLIHRDSEAWDLLDHAVQGRGVASGPKGQRFAWSVVGNYTDVDTFVEALRSFWEDLLSDDRPPEEAHASPSRYDAILVVYQGEADPTAHAIQIARADPADQRQGLCIRRAAVPFGFSRED